MGPATWARADECLNGGGDAGPEHDLAFARLGADESLVGSMKIYEDSLAARFRYHNARRFDSSRCSCSALREVAVLRECGKCKSLYTSVIERCVTLPVGTWSVARKQFFRFDGSHVHNVTTSHFERKETKFVSNKTAIYRRNRSSVCLLFVKLALLCVFFWFIRPITYTRASREHALNASGSSKPELQQRRQLEGVNV